MPVLLLAACGGSGTNTNPDEDAGIVEDLGSKIDTGTPIDTGGPIDTGPPEDTGIPVDTGVIEKDAGTPEDTGNPEDTGTAEDTGSPVDTGNPEDAGNPEDTGSPVDTGTPEDVVAPTDTGPTCGTGEAFCGGACIDVQSNNNNCGACGTVCPAGQSCRTGTCTPNCAPSESLCGTPAACVNTQTNAANCGACGNACPTGQMCVMGSCSVVCDAPRTICLSSQGAQSCVDLQGDTANCGACNNACPMGQSCTAGTCQLACAPGQTPCNGVCVDLRTSAGNCGACGNACATGQICGDGQCRRSCGMNETLCNDACVNTQTDTANCGACGISCRAGQSCTAGSCVCPTGETVCNNTCTNTQNSNAHCGACNMACPTGQNCITGMCRAMAPVNDLPINAIPLNLASPSVTVTGSTTGATRQGDCGAAPEVYYRFTLTQREVVYADTFGSAYDTTVAFASGTGLTTVSGTCNDDSSCGGLQSQTVTVLAPGTYYVVVGGFNTNTGNFTLRFQHLPAGGGAVNRITSTATGLQTFMGTTTGTSAFSTSCGGGSGPEVAYYFTTCPNFVQTAFTASTCGAATWDTVLEQRSAGRTPLSFCNDDACSVQSTVTGNIPAAQGLHTLYVDGFGGASGAYTLSLRFGTCPTGQSLCGSTCVDLQTSVANCGTCGTACGTGQVCAAGRCGCPTGQLLCGNACVTPTTDRNNCGACGRVCSTGFNCTAGACVCPTGQSNCNGTCRTLTTDTANCGACGTVCPTGSACTAGACVCPTGQTACGNACRNLTSDNSNCGACGRVCGAGTTCVSSVCRPTNDTRTSATTLTLSAGETVVNGSTTGATFDGPAGCGTTPLNVWYRVTLSAREVLYADTSGGNTNYDTRLYIVDNAGALVANTCNDDSGCGTSGGFTSGLQSRTSVVLNAGTYFIAVGGFGATSAGNFTLRVQHLATTSSFFYSTAIAGTAVTGQTSLIGTSAASGTCGGASSGEDLRWFMTCGGRVLFSVCQGDGGSFFRRPSSTSTTIYDPLSYVRSGQSGAEVACNDDGPSTANCVGTNEQSSGLQRGARIDFSTFPRGIGTVFMDGLNNSTGMSYRMSHIIPN